MAQQFKDMLNAVGAILFKITINFVAHCIPLPGAGALIACSSLQPPTPMH